MTNTEPIFIEGKIEMICRGDVRLNTGCLVCEKCEQQLREMRGEKTNNISLTVPTFVILPRKKTDDKKIYLGYNQVRNLHRMTLGQCKTVFAEQFNLEIGRVKEDFKRMNESFLNPVYKMTFVVTSKDQRRFDISNLCGLYDKFACDCLVKAGLIPEDNFDYIKEVVYKFGGITGMRTCKLQVEAKEGFMQ